MSILFLTYMNKNTDSLLRYILTEKNANQSGFRSKDTLKIQCLENLTELPKRSGSSVRNS